MQTPDEIKTIVQKIIEEHGTVDWELLIELAAHRAYLLGFNCGMSKFLFHTKTKSNCNVTISAKIDDKLIGKYEGCDAIICWNADGTFMDKKDSSLDLVEVP